jgi:uncharacterized protein (TIGR00297 family)
MILAVVASIVLQKLTVAGGITGGLLAVLIYLGVGLTGILMLGLFFLLGTIATRWQASFKNQLPTAAGETSQRTARQVLANGGVAGLAGLMAIVWPALEELWLVMMAGCLSSATADTLASELGSVYGKRFYNILSFKRDQRGLDGVVSVEGLLIGIGGSLLIACLYSLEKGWQVAFWIIVVAGTLGNVMDSILGAALERKGLLKNNVVNFCNTLVGSIVAAVLYIISNQ